MSNDMINTLVKNKILKQGSNVEANYNITSMNGLGVQSKDYFEVVEVNTDEDLTKVKWFMLYRKNDGMSIKAPPESILSIDGMAISRILESHELKIEENIESVTKRKYMHTNHLNEEVEYTEITYSYKNGKTKKERFDETGEKVRRGRKRIHPLREN